ncbi:hypothetical protein [uncultured Lacinutrix sp.]|uniref:OB-fold protein n=1 Tax=uncultured Lacinutrix sp. TaxID=574032 RepID=UPI0026319358|nr:hypothetical protein [uncultured Lacinutrix sp.]
MKKIKWIALLLIVVLAYLGYNYIYQDHRNISEEKAAFSVTAVSLQEKFSNDTQASETKFLNKVIEITGQVSEINETDFTLDDAVFCSVDKSNALSKDNLSKTITIKGRCIGYDDLLEQIKLDQCTIIN